MTLCYCRPPRSYDTQFVLDGIDVYGLLKILRERVLDETITNEARLRYSGALTAFEALFGMAEADGRVDYAFELIESIEGIIEDKDKGGESAS